MYVRDNKKESILPYFCRQCFVTSSTTSPKWFLSELVNDITQSMVQSTVILIVISTTKNDKDNNNGNYNRPHMLWRYRYIGIYFQIFGFCDRVVRSFRISITIYNTGTFVLRVTINPICVNNSRINESANIFRNANVRHDQCMYHCIIGQWYYVI